jgi:hypothetical protein
MTGENYSSEEDQPSEADQPPEEEQATEEWIEPPQDGSVKRCLCGTPKVRGPEARGRRRLWGYQRL